MTDARRAFNLQVALAALGAAVVAAAVLVALSRVRLDPGAVAASCSRFAPSVPDVVAALVLTLTLVGLGAAFGTILSLSRELLRSRRAARRLESVAPLSESGIHAWVFEDCRAVAFCAGLLRPRVYVSSGAVEQLSPVALRAVLVHEQHHARSRDPLRLLMMRALADALFFLPALRRLADRYADLAELDADDAAIRQARDVRPLAAALVAFDEQNAWIAPERVDRLLGTTVRWRPPMPLLLGALGTIAGMGATGVALAWTTTQASVAVPAMFGHVCVIVLTAVLAGLFLLPLRR